VFRQVASVSLGLLFLTSAFAQIFDVQLRGTWFKRADTWCVRIDVPTPPGAQVSTRRMEIEATDARTHESLHFDVEARGTRRRGNVIELRFAVDHPRHLSLVVRGLDIRDESGRALLYTQMLNVAAPPAMADEHPHLGAGARAGLAGPAGGGAPPEPPLTPGQGAPAPEPLNAPLVGSQPEDALDLPAEAPASRKKGKRKIDIPQFPFPPPRASVFQKIPREFFVAKNATPRLRDVEATLTAAFERCGYGDKSFYAVPDGFAMASRLEQMNADGTPGPERWSLEVNPMRKFAVRDYLQALFHARPGHYRVVVFMVTNHPFKQKDAKVNSDEAGAWVREGLNELPSEIGDRDFTDDYACTALIYEFKRVGNGAATFVEPSELSAHDHLDRSGLLSAMQGHGR
jgi:hypothetical protein